MPDIIESQKKYASINRARSRQIFDIIGWRYIYSDALRCGAFGRTLREVYNAPFRTLIYTLNLLTVAGDKD